MDQVDFFFFFFSFLVFYVCSPHQDRRRLERSAHSNKAKESKKEGKERTKKEKKKKKKEKDKEWFGWIDLVVELLICLVVFSFFKKQGNFGNVYRAKLDDAIVAVKELLNPEPGAQEDDMDVYYKREVRFSFENFFCFFLSLFLFCRWLL